MHRLTREATQGALADIQGHPHTRLELDQGDRTAHYLIRPDGHIAYRGAGKDLTGLCTHLDRWLPGARLPAGAEF